MCAHAEFIAFRKTEYIRGPVCTGTCMVARLCGRPCSCPCRLAWTPTVLGRGEGVRGASHRVLHLLRYGVALAAVLCRSRPAGTAGNSLVREVGPGVDTMTS